MTAVPATLDALVTLATGALPRGAVLDGPWLNTPDSSDVVVIGWTPDEGETVDYVDAFAGLASDLETFDVTNYASSWRGDGDMRTTRAQADGLVETLRAALKADQTLGGVVTRARLVTLSLSQLQAERGSEVQIEFAIRVEAFRTV